MTSTPVSPHWLHQHLSDPNLIILDATLASNKAGKTIPYPDQHIPGTQFFDLKGVFSNQNAAFPNTLPSAKQFEQGCQDLGIHPQSKVVVYDAYGIYTSPRAWWLFRAMGHANVMLLDGGLPAWIGAGFATTKALTTTSEIGTFKAQYSPANVTDFNSVKENSKRQESWLIDVRSEARFNGTATEPRAGLRSGHIPNSINIPYPTVLENGRYKSQEALKAIFEQHITDDRPIAFSCGSGITACIVLLAAQMVLDNPVALYDGSWTEYASLTA